MKRTILTLTAICGLLLLFSCSSTLHLYDGRQYLPDEELGTLIVTEFVDAYKFNGKLIQKTNGSTVIKAKPGNHNVTVIAKDENGKSQRDEKNGTSMDVQKTIAWDAVEGRKYELVFSDSNTDLDNLRIIDITDTSTL